MGILSALRKVYQDCVTTRATYDLTERTMRLAKEAHIEEVRVIVDAMRSARDYSQGTYIRLAEQLLERLGDDND